MLEPRVQECFCSLVKNLGPTSGHSKVCEHGYLTNELFYLTTETWPQYVPMNQFSFMVHGGWKLSLETDKPGFRPQKHHFLAVGNPGILIHRMEMRIVPVSQYSSENKMYAKWLSGWPALQYSCNNNYFYFYWSKNKNKNRLWVYYPPVTPWVHGTKREG